MKILITGQCSLHWGRMEFGNIGNYYIIEPFVRKLHEVFSGATISTTFQMSERFCKDENVNVLPMDWFYGWNNDLEKANDELSKARKYLETGEIDNPTEYIKELLNTDLVIDFSGDIWGDNADFLGEDRFYVGLCKDRVAQVFAKKAVMLAGSPGPFGIGKNLDFAKEVYLNFDLVTNREFISKGLMSSYGFDVSKTHSLGCPAFLFEPARIESVKKDKQVAELLTSPRAKVGFVICGWNFTNGPFDKWPRVDADYTVFAEAIEQFAENVDADIYLMSHSNGFPVSPAPFELKHGRDYPIIKQLQKVLERRGITKNIYALDGIYDAWQTKAIIGQFDMFVSGRVHAAVSALSQYVPTVIIDYGHEPKAHKLKGFAEVAGALDFVAQPDVDKEILDKMILCWKNRLEYRNRLENRISEVKELAEKNFEILKNLFA